MMCGLFNEFLGFLASLLRSLHLCSSVLRAFCDLSGFGSRVMLASELSSEVFLSLQFLWNGLSRVSINSSLKVQ